MAGIRHLVHCLAGSLCANALKALAHLVPLGAVLYDVAENTAQRLREQRQDDQLTDLIAGARPPARVVLPSPAPAGPTDLPLCWIDPPAQPEGRLARFLRTGETGLLPWVLDLTHCAIGDEGAQRLAASPHLAHLTVLIAWGCDIGDLGASALAASPHLAQVTRLDLGRNRIGDAGACALAASEHVGNLRELLLVSNQIGDEGARAIAHSARLTQLAWLKPLDNPISAHGAAALREAFGKRVRVM